MFGTKEIACFPFLQEQATFVIPKAGYYTVYIHGKLLKAVPTNWLPDIRHIATNEKVEIKSVWLRIQHTDFDKGRLELYGFHAQEKGDYVFQHQEVMNNILDTTRTRITKLFENISSQNMEKDLLISIRTGNNNLGKLLLFPQMFLVFVGLLGIVFGIILTVNPEAFNK